MIRVQDVGEVTYGGAVTLAEWWDRKRITQNKIMAKDVLKKAGLYAYLVPGVIASAMSALGLMRKYETWAEHISHGFMYDLPRFAYNLSQDLKTTGGGSNVVSEAQRILRERQAATGQYALGGGQQAQRSYQPEFNKTMAW